MKKSFLVKHFSSPGKMGACRNCDRKNCANCSIGSNFSETVHKFAAKQQQVSKVNPDFRYIRFRAIGNLEIDGYNENFDAFPYSEFTDSRPGYGYQSFVDKKAFVEHQSDDVEKSIGTLLGAYLNRFDTSKYSREWGELTSEERIDILEHRTPEEDGSVEVLMAVDAKLSPSIARQIDTDVSLGCSMGTNIIHSDCSVCGNRARYEWEYCFVPGTLILLEDGTTKEIEKVQVGDKVITHKGKTKKVTKIYERDVNEEILNITYRDKPYASLKVTKNHPFLVSQNKDVICKYWAVSNPETQYCKQGDIHLCEQHNCFSKKIETDFVAANNISLGDFLVTPRVNKIRTTTISKKLAKLLGFFIAEGSYLRQGPTGKLSSLSFCIGHHELKTLGNEIISLCKELFGKKCFVSKRLNSKTGKVSSYDIRCHDSKVAEKFYSLVGKGAKTKKLSLELMYTPVDVQLELLKGWFLGDGCFSSNVITTSSKDLADQLVFLLARQGFITSARPTNNQVGFAKHIENNLIYRIPVSRSFIEEKFLGLSKPNKFKFCITNDNFLQQVSGIKKNSYKGKVYNLEVEDDNSYIANGVAVHNCNHVAYSKGATILVPANQIRNLLKEGKLRPEWIKWVLHREADQKEVLKGKTSRMVTATVFEINYGLSFFELSVVANPAYIRGYKLEKIASLLKKGFQQLLPLVRVDDDEVEVHIDVTNEYFNSSTAKKAKLYGKNFDDWTDLEKVAYLRDGELAKNALSSRQVRKVYVEREHQSKLEKFGAKFTPMDNPSFVQLTNPEILLKLKFAVKEDFMKFGAMEYKNTGLDLTDIHDFKILVSQQGKQPQELVDYIYQLAGKDEKKLRDTDDYVKMLQTKYKVVPRKYPFEKKLEEKYKFKDRGGEKVMGVRKKKTASSWTDLTNNFEFSEVGEHMTLEDLDQEANNVEAYINDFIKANDLETLKEWIQKELVDEDVLAEGISVDDVLQVFKKYVHPRLFSKKEKKTAAEKTTETEVRQDSDFMKKVDQLSKGTQKKFIGAYVGAHNYAVEEEKSNPKEYAARVAWDKVPTSEKEAALVAPFVKKAELSKTSLEYPSKELDAFGQPRTISDEALEEMELEPRVGLEFETDRIDFVWDRYRLTEKIQGRWKYEVVRRKETSKKKAVYDGLPSTAEDIKDQGIEIEKTELKVWDEMSEKGDKMIEKEKRSRAPGVIFLEDSVSAAKVVRDTKKAVQDLLKQAKAAIEVLAGELPPGLKEYMEKKKEEKGEAGPAEEKPTERPPTGRPPAERPPERKPEEREPGERKPEEKPPESAKEVLQDAVVDLKEVQKDLEEVEEKLEEKAEKPLAKVLDGKKRYGRHLKIAVEEALKEAKPVIEDAQDAVEDAQKIIQDTIKDLKTVEKGEKPEKAEEGGETVTEKLSKIVGGADSIRKANKQLTEIFAEEKKATAFPPTGARDPGDYGAPPVDKELATWKGFYNEYKKMKGKEDRTEFDTPAGRVDLLTGIVAKLFLNREKKGNSYWLVTKEGGDFAIKSTFADVAGDNQTEENFKKFCSNFYHLQILQAVTKTGLDEARREMFGKWVKVKKEAKAAEYEGRPIKEIPKGEYDTHEGDKASGQPRKGVEPTDAKAATNERGYYSEAYGDSGYAGELTKGKVAKIVVENEKLRNKVKVLEADRIADALAKKAVDLARKAAAAGVIPFDTESVTEKAKEYSELDDTGFKAVEETLDALPVVNAKALKAYQIPEAENVDSGIVYDATDSVEKERIEHKHPDELKLDNMKPDLEQAAKLSKKRADFVEGEEVTPPPVRERSRFEDRPRIEREVEEPEIEEEPEMISESVKDRIRKKASVVPQLRKKTADLENRGSVPDFTERFTTIGNKLRKKGINHPPQVHYRSK